MPVPRNPAPSYMRLREALSYCPITGIFTNRINRRKARAGEIAGWTSGGRCCIRLDGEEYLAHRLAWFYITAQWPFEIDHKDLDRTNNCWTNLRECSHHQNLCNRPIHKNNKCGFKGVHIIGSNGRYRARLRWHGELVLDACFATAEEAHATYAAKAKELHGEFARAA